MEIILIMLVPILFLALGAAMMVVSQVSGFFTFRRYSSRQRVSNRIIGTFIGRIANSRRQLALRGVELEEAARTLAASNEALAALNNLKSKFLSMAVHDVRTPLGTIRGYAEMLSEKTVDPKAAKYVNGILVASDQVGRLVGDLTDLAVIEAGKFRMDKQPFAIDPLVSEIMSTFVPLAAKNGVELSLIGAATGLVVVADRFRVGQVLSNLIGNALKFTPRGGQVRVEARSSPGAAAFIVSDTGPGVDPAEKRKIFEKFYQSKNAAAADGRKGWGLGLSLAFEIVKEHDGGIGVDSAGLGRGSKFWFTIPLQPTSAGRRALSQLRSLILIPVLAAVSFAQPIIPLDEKARFDRFLEEKAEGVLLKMLGPNRSKVVVDATLDFTRTEKFEITMGAKKVDAAGKIQGYAWQNVSAQQGSGRELLPGIPADPGELGVPQSYERQVAYPASFVKRLVVNIVLDRSVTVEQADTIQTIVSDLLEITPDRGDALTVVRASFAPIWKTVWYSHDSFSMMFRYSMLGLITLIALVVVASCFIRLAGAMEAMAQAQTQQYATDLNLGGPAATQESEAALPGPKAQKALEAESTEEEDILINVRRDQLPALVQMLKAEDPENIALVAAHLENETRRAFLHELPRDVEIEVLMRLSAVRFVEPELIEKIKEEIEHRLSGAVGGLSSVYDVIDSASPELQRQILKDIEMRDPEVYKLVRSRVVLLDDLARMNGQEWLLLMGRTKIEDWAVGLRAAPKEALLAIQSHVLPKTWTYIKQAMESTGATQEKVAQAQAMILTEVRKLMDEGRIHDLRQPPAEALAQQQPAQSAPAAQPAPSA